MNKKEVIENFSKLKTLLEKSPENKDYITLLTNLQKSNEKTNDSYSKFKSKYKKMFDELKNSLLKNQKVEKEKEEIFAKKKTLEREISQLKDEKAVMQEKISSLKKSELEFSYFQSSKTLNSLILNKEIITKNNFLLECNDKLEEKVVNLERENNTLKMDNNSFMQKYKIMEQELISIKNQKNHHENYSQVDENSKELKEELELMKVTNSVYLEKINELIENMKKMDEGNYQALQENSKKMKLLKKQNDEYKYKLHLLEEKKDDKKRPSLIKTLNSNSKMNLDNKDLETLKKDYENLEYLVLELKQTNMKYKNKILEYQRKYNRSKSPISKKKK